MFSILELFDDLPSVCVVDVGASPLDGEPPYQPLMNAGLARLIGFEPAIDQLEALQEMNIPNATFLPHAVGNGEPGELKICRSPGMTSLMEPDMDVLNQLYGFPDWAEVIERQPVETVRLDDVSETAGMDFLKLDVQGGEGLVLDGAEERIQSALCVHTEVNFVPFYKDQPLFAELDIRMRQAGYYFHKFSHIFSRMLRPMQNQGNVYAECSQELWSDAVYIRRFTDFENLSCAELLKLALIMHELYLSIDVVTLLLTHVDRIENGNRAARYQLRVQQALAAM